MTSLLFVYVVVSHIGNTSDCKRSTERKWRRKRVDLQMCGAAFPSELLQLVAYMQCPSVQGHVKVPQHGNSPQQETKVRAPRVNYNEFSLMESLLYLFIPYRLSFITLTIV
jgi:hypothetical protein